MIVTVKFVNGTNGHKFATHNREYKIENGEWSMADEYSESGWTRVFASDVMSDIKHAANRTEIMHAHFATDFVIGG